MKFYIYKEWKKEPTEESATHKHYSCQTHFLSEYVNGTPEESQFQKFKCSFEEKFGTTNPLTINLDAKNLNNTGTVNYYAPWDVTIEGDIVGKLQKFLGFGSDSLKMNLEITKFLGRNQRRNVVSLSEFVPDNDVLYPTIYRGKCSVSSDFANDTEMWTHDISLSITKPIYLATEDLLDVVPKTNLNILERQKLCDFEILVDDEEEASIPCHKIFLHAGSPVFATMLEGKFAEASQHQMKLEGISRSGIHALLKFLYYSDLVDVLASPSVALELLQLADQYDMPILWKAIITLLLKVEHGWFDVETALKLYEFVRNRDDDDQNKKLLMKRVIQVMALKSNQLPKCSLFLEIFSNPVSRDILNLALDANKP